MPLTRVRIYPSGKFSKIRTKKLKTKTLTTNIDIIKFSNTKYLELVNETANVSNVISDVIVKIMEFTNSGDGFLAILDDTDPVKFNYYCIYNKTTGITFAPTINGMEVPPIHSILIQGIKNDCNIISNDVATDPRFNVVRPKDHIAINTLLLLPLRKDNIVIGQLCLANSTKYTCSIIEKIFPLQQFLINFVYLWQKRKLSVDRELAIKHQVVTLKDTFIATMSHEIRTPLNGIVGMAKLLSESDNLTDKQMQYLGILADCSTQLMELVNDILDYSKMASGKMVLNNYPFNLRSCILKTIEIIKQRADEKKLEIRVNIPDHLPENVTGDSRRLKQVLFNLLINAIKFTEKGYIEISVDYEDVVNEIELFNKSKRIVFVIKDTGIGIPINSQKDIFDVFTKLPNDSDTIYTSTTPGSGMGLSISKYIVESMGGRISVESSGKHGEGSTFKFDVILEDETDIVQLLALHGEELKNKYAVIIDDNEDNRIFLADSLYSWGISALSFSSGREALNFLHKKQKFDIAIVDLCMPNMSGLEVVQSMRELGFSQPVIGLSSIGINIAGQEWFDHFVMKPISKSRLFNLILRCFITKEQQQLSISKKVASFQKLNGNDMRIIIAEDDYYNQIVLTEILKKLGYHNLTIVGNGQLCVDKIRKQAFDLCLMDVKMPIMDGIEATRLIKQLQNPPVIIAVSASVLDSDKNKCFTAGMDGYIPKPIQKEQLESLLKSLGTRAATTTF